MEELLVKFEELLDRKFETKFAELKQEIQEVKQDVAELKEELQGMKSEIEEVKQNVEDLKQEMLDQFVLFENEYGDRILAIGDSALIDNQKNVKRAKKMHQLEERMDAHEIKLAVCRNDIFKLQQKVK